jgi:tetratricopeptide (TPR) repeat protein
VRTIARGWRTALVWTVVLVAFLCVSALNVTNSGALGSAQVAYARGDLNNCVRHALDHLERRPWSREAALLAARGFSRLDYAELAEPYFKRAGRLSLADLQLRAYGLARSPHPERAIPAYNEIVARWPDNVTALRRLAAVLLSQDRTADLLKLADHLSRVANGAVIGATVRGVVYHNDHNPQAAAAAFEHVLELDPELREMPLPRRLFWSHLADDLIAGGRIDDASNYLSKAVAANNDFDLMNRLGRVYFLKGAFDDAERCYRQAADWAPEEYAPYLSLARLAQQRRRPEEALEYLNKARTLAPWQYDVRFSLASVYRQLGHTALAEQVQATLKPARSRPDLPARPAFGPWPRYAL